ncbi:hypothetical protein HII31_13357 [Pseudocercospora fuligena]|uniref:Uncharacterized protein n=1 Tax=Pseudocercospora fuligena TaxID=685502 RepID=A0A8H6R6C1_9PEZI|nr:hypothetical protein HII31_13357 [Pseudocercospora fuligena]
MFDRISYHCPPSLSPAHRKPYARAKFWVLSIAAASGYGVSLCYMWLQIQNNAQDFDSMMKAADEQARGSVDSALIARTPEGLAEKHILDGLIARKSYPNMIQRPTHRWFDLEMGPGR